MPDTIKRTQLFRFDQMAVQVKDKVEPEEAVVDRYVGLEHIDPESLKIRRWGEPSDVESSKILFRSGDIIFGKRRAYQRKLAVADFDGICSAHAMVLRPKTDVVLEEFLPFFMQSDIFMDRAVKISVGGLSPTINWRDLAKEAFALPQLEEQRRVVSVLASVDESIQATQTLIDHIGRVKDRLLQDLLTKGIGHTEFKKTVVGEIPAGWEVHRLDSLASFRRGSFPQPYGSPEWYDDENGHPFVQVYDVGDDMRLKQMTKKRISDLAAEKSVFVPTGSIILTIQGSIGRIALTQYDVYLDRTLLVFREFLRDVHPYFFMNAVYHLFQQEKRKAPGSTIKTITKEKLSGFKISLPPLAEQQKIAAIISSVDKNIADGEERVTQLQRVRAGLLQDLLTSKGAVVSVKPQRERTLLPGDHA